MKFSCSLVKISLFPLIISTGLEASIQLNQPIKTFHNSSLIQSKPVIPAPSHLSTKPPLLQQIASSWGIIQEIKDHPIITLGPVVATLWGAISQKSTLELLTKTQAELANNDSPIPLEKRVATYLAQRYDFRSIPKYQLTVACYNAISSLVLRSFDASLVHSISLPVLALFFGSTFSSHYAPVFLSLIGTTAFISSVLHSNRAAQTLLSCYPFQAAQCFATPASYLGKLILDTIVGQLAPWLKKSAVDDDDTFPITKEQTKSYKDYLIKEMAAETAQAKNVLRNELLNRETSESEIATQLSKLEDEYYNQMVERFYQLIQTKEDADFKELFKAAIISFKIETITKKMKATSFKNEPISTIESTINEIIRQVGHINNEFSDPTIKNNNEAKKSAEEKFKELLATLKQKIEEAEKALEKGLKGSCDKKTLIKKFQGSINNALAQAKLDLVIFKKQEQQDDKK